MHDVIQVEQFCTACCENKHMYTTTCGAVVEKHYTNESTPTVSCLKTKESFQKKRNSEFNERFLRKIVKQICFTVGV